MNEAKITLETKGPSAPAAAVEVGLWHQAVATWIRQRIAAYEARDGVVGGAYSRLIIANPKANEDSYHLALEQAVLGPLPAEGGPDLIALHGHKWYDLVESAPVQAEEPDSRRGRQVSHAQAHRLLGRRRPGDARRQHDRR